MPSQWIRASTYEIWGATIQFIACGNGPDVGDDTTKFTSAQHRIRIHTSATTDEGT